MKKVFLFLGACLTAATLSAQVATINITDVVFSNNKTNYQSAEQIFNVSNPIAVDDEVTITVKGKISSAVEGLQAYLVECSATNSYGWNVLSGYEDVSSALAAGADVDLNFTLKATGVSEGTEIRAYLITTNAPVAEVANIAINESGIAPEAPYEDETLGKLSSMWGPGNEVNGKVMTFAASDSGIGFASYNGMTTDLSGKVITLTVEEFPSWATYGQVVVTHKAAAGEEQQANVTAAFNENVAVIDMTDVPFAASLDQIFFQVGGTGNLVLSSVEIKDAEQGGGEETAVESVSADAFAVVGGMVYSAGEITVYNVAGKAIASASQSFNVNSLESGVYFITAPEGTIKFVK